MRTEHAILQQDHGNPTNGKNNINQQELVQVIKAIIKTSLKNS